MAGDSKGAGATPVASDAKSDQNAEQAPEAKSLATGEESLGDAGKRALDAERQTARDALTRATSAESELKRVQKAQAEREQAGETEAQKLQRQVAELEQQLSDMTVRDKERSVRLAAVEAAGKLGFRNPELAFRLLDRAAIEYREDGSPKNVEKLLRDVLETDAYLGKPNGGPDYGGGPRGTPPDSTPDMNTLLRRAARG